MPPTFKELNELVARISERVARYLERQGWLSRDEQSDHLNLAMDDEGGATLQQLQGHSITYRIAIGPQAGRKVLAACAARCKQFEAWEEDDYGTGQLGKVGGFSLHGGGLPSGVAVYTHERKKLERICPTISRPALSAGTIRADRSGHGQLCLDNSVPARPDRDGSTHVMFERDGLPPLDRDAQSLWPNWQRWCPSLERI